MIGDLTPETEEELPLVLEQEGITSVKVFMAYAKEFQATDRTLFKAFKIAKELGAVVMVHCENGSVIDELVEEAKRAGHTEPIYHALTRPAEVEGKRQNEQSNWRILQVPSFTSYMLLVKRH